MSVKMMERVSKYMNLSVFQSRKLIIEAFHNLTTEKPKAEVIGYVRLLILVM